MRTLIFILPVLIYFLPGTAIGQRTELAETCYPTDPEVCPSDPIDECPTCCCESSDNVEFYNPDAPEPECTAPPAIYEVRIMYTWSDICHPDYYFDDSQWLRPVGATHNTVYRLWDACMNVSEGVIIYSENGERDEIGNEMLNQILGGNILDGTVNPGVIQGSGSSTGDIVVEKGHQFLSVITRQVPSPDHIVGVADLRLCDGDKWREKVKVCMELFSTGATSGRVAGEMERNSVQENNCSFGYIEFNLKQLSEYVPRTPLEKNCYPMIPDKCPRSDTIDECPTCCCESSDNVEFYDPDAREPECTAPTAVYKITVSYTWSDICHPDYYFPSAAFTPPSSVSHNPRYRMWDACMDNASIGVGILSQAGAVIVVEQEYSAAGDNAGSSSVGNVVFGGVGSTSSNLTMDKDHQYVSWAAMLAPSPDRMVGVADLRLCDGDKWREKVKVCLEHFSTATASEKVAGKMERNSLQANNCSFGYVEYELLVNEASTESSAITMAVNISILCALAIATSLLMMN